MSFFKREWGYLLIIVVLVILSCLQVSGFRYGFFTAYDEAYFLLKLQEAYDMSCITGKSQWNLLAVHWFPYMDLTSKVNSRLASSILIWASILSVSMVASITNRPNRFLKYLAITWLVMFGLNGEFCYVPMQTAMLTWALCAFVMFYHSGKVWVKCMFAAICGLMLGLACFIIIPAALALLVLIMVLIVITYRSDSRMMLTYLASGIIGGVISLIYIHFMVCDLSQIVDAMLYTATYIGKSGYGYDGMSFIIKYGLFARDCLFAILAFTGAYWLSNRIKERWIGGLLYVAMILIYSHYQVKPIVTPSMLLLSVPLVPILFSKDSIFSSVNFWKDKQFWYYLFLLSFPLVASLGTNTALSGRIHFFMAGWLFLWFEMEESVKSINMRRVYLSVLILFAIPMTDTVKSYSLRDDTYHFTRGNKYFAEIAITKKQKDYFDRVYDILEQYNYEPHKSPVLTALYDYCCLYAFDAVNAANYHQVQNFAYFPKEKMIEPDFIFLCPWDSIVMAKDLEAMPWGWPEEFDCHYVGTPEPEGAPWVNHPNLETRTLYCRKSLKKED